MTSLLTLCFAPISIYIFVAVVLLMLSQGNIKISLGWPYYLIRMWSGKKDFEKRKSQD